MGKGGCPSHPIPHSTVQCWDEEGQEKGRHRCRQRSPRLRLPSPLRWEPGAALARGQQVALLLPATGPARPSSLLTGDSFVGACWQDLLPSLAFLVDAESCRSQDTPEQPGLRPGMSRGAVGVVVGSYQASFTLTLVPVESQFKFSNPVIFISI